MKLKKKDTVVILAGKDKGKKGEIKEIMPEKNSAARSHVRNAALQPP